MSNPEEPTQDPTLAMEMEAKYAAFVETMGFGGNSDDITFNKSTGHYEVGYLPASRFNMAIRWE